mgnify:CR=1 FL=1|tara:strand:+ start:871 stop:1134 length:264 start_codon:yes stop_codon:yes gene_type:complete
MDRNECLMEPTKVQHFKKDCIACGACAAIAPEFWEMDEEGYADLKGSELHGDHYQLKLKSLEEKTINQEAADVCPVQIIHVVKDDDS